MTAVRLRAFYKDDFEWIMALERSAFPLDAYTPAMLRQRIDVYREGFRVAVIGDELVGYIAAWVLNGKARIDSMAVADQHRRCGIGSAMVDFALRHFREQGFKEVELEVRPANQNAIELYKKLGFIETGIKPRYYEADGSDALLMKRSLTI